MYVDIAVGIIVFISVLVSFLRGFIREVLTIAGLIAGIAAAIVIGPVLEAPLMAWLSSDPANPTKIFGVIPAGIFASALAYGLTFIIVTLAVSFLTFLITRGVHAAGLGLANRLFGVLFGALRGVLLISLLYLPFYYAEPEDGYSWMANAHSKGVVRLGSQFIDEQLVDKIFAESEEEVEEDASEAVEEIIEESSEEKTFFDFGKEIAVEELKDQN